MSHALPPLDGDKGETNHLRAVLVDATFKLQHQESVETDFNNTFTSIRIYNKLALAN